jgi:catechol 2,3-dioxygenase-like lactoylglutathione lyase family enzyme
LTGAPPRSGWAKLVPELHVHDLPESLAFWQGVLGFATAYAREAERFVYLEHPEGHQIMLCQRNGRFETGPMLRPLGQGAMFQLYFADLDPILAALATAPWPIHTALREVWRDTGARQSGQREIFVQDPDGYLLMLAQNIGMRDGYVK